VITDDPRLFHETPPDARSASAGEPPHVQ
jgi:hypothetical protein